MNRELKINLLIYSLIIFNFIISIFLITKNLYLNISLIIGICFYLNFFFHLFVNYNKNLKIDYIFIIFFISYWSFIFLPGINAYDDLSSYLVFAEKTIDNGLLPVEELSVRRSYTLGSLFLFKGIFSKINSNFIVLVEPILGLILISTLIIIFNKNKFKRSICLSLLFITPFLGSKVILNSEPVWIMVFFSYIMIHLIYISKKKNNFLVLSLIILCLSLLYRPTTFLFNFLSIFYSLFYLKKKIIKLLLGKELLIFVVIGSVIFFPYINALYQSSGTFIYPITGTGWHTQISIFADFPLNHYESIHSFKDLIFFSKDILFGNLIFLITLLIFLFIYLNKKNKFYIYLFIIYIINYVAVSSSIGIDWAPRYTFPISLSIILFFFILFNFSNFFNLPKIINQKSIFALTIILSIFVAIFKSPDVNLKRKNSQAIGYDVKLINQISGFDIIDKTEKVLLHSIFS